MALMKRKIGTEPTAGSRKVSQAIAQSVPHLLTRGIQKAKKTAHAIKSSNDDVQVNEAAEQVFSVTELLENILVNLDFDTLLLLQRVNQKFRAVIGGSVPLQKKLFFVHCTFDEAKSLGMLDNEAMGHIRLRRQRWNEAHWCAPQTHPPNHEHRI